MLCCHPLKSISAISCSSFKFGGGVVANRVSRPSRELRFVGFTTPCVHGALYNVNFMCKHNLSLLSFSLNHKLNFLLDFFDTAFAFGS